MAGILTQAHTRRLEALHRVRHILQGEDPSIVFLQRTPGTNALSQSLTISQNWTYTDRDASGDKLPPEVRFELQVAEPLFTKANLQQTVAVQHGQKIFRIVRPSPFEPTGFQRFWRFWLAPAEE
jgi:hypothetical protein